MIQVTKWNIRDKTLHSEYGVLTWGQWSEKEVERIGKCITREKKDVYGNKVVAVFREKRRI